MSDKTYLASCSDDNCAYKVQKKTNEVVKFSEEISKPLTEPVKDNQTKLNPDRCHLISSDGDIKAINVCNFITKNCKNEKLLAFTFDNKTNFLSCI